MRVAPPNTLLPISLQIGLASPVNMDSLQNPFPKTTTPSIGTPPPGYILIRSLTCNKSTSISVSFVSKVTY